MKYPTPFIIAALFCSTAAAAPVRRMVIRVLAFALRQDSAATKQSKKSQVAWRNRQAKYNVFARQTLVIPSAVEEARSITEKQLHGILSTSLRSAQDDELIRRRLSTRAHRQSCLQLCAAGNT